MERKQRHFYKLDTPTVLAQGTTPPDESIRSYTGVRIETVTDGKTEKGTPYRTIEYTDPDGAKERLNIWDKKTFDPLEPGVPVDWSMQENETGL